MNKEENVEEVKSTEEETQEEGPLSENIELFKQESYTDGQLVYLDIMTPMTISKSGKLSVNKDGRKRFIGKSQVDFGGRVMPYTFIIENARTAKEAIDQFDDALSKALERTREQVEEMQKEQEEKEKKIIVPNKDKKIIT